MTTYKVHDELGGYECTLAPDHIHAGSSWPNHQLVSVPSETVGHWYVLVPKTALTKVKPSLPPEPTELGWYLATIGDSEVPFERQTDGWWNATYRDFKESWERLHEDYPGITMVRLVRAPVPGAALPWSHTDKFGDCATVDGARDSDGNVLLKIETASGRISTVVVPAQELLGVAWAVAVKVPETNPAAAS